MKHDCKHFVYVDAFIIFVVGFPTFKIQEFQNGVAILA